MCGVQLKDRKTVKHFMQILALIKALDQLANAVRWYGHVLKHSLAPLQLLLYLHLLLLLLFMTMMSCHLNDGYLFFGLIPNISVASN